MLIAHLQEHSDAIVALRVSFDNVFFLSASADGSVRVWDCYRLEKKKSNRHRLLHYQGPRRLLLFSSVQVFKADPGRLNMRGGGGGDGTGGKLTALTFLENSHMFASASSDGSLHLCRCVAASPRARTKAPVGLLTVVEHGGLGVERGG